MRNQPRSHPDVFCSGKWGWLIFKGIMDPRAQQLLKTLIERYIADGEPVGSRALSKFSGLELSPATVRNVMADLEELGFIASPHTSAGRIPTVRGYRLFVDTLLVTHPVEQAKLEQLTGHLHPDQPQRLISAASQLLADLTSFAGIVAAPRRRQAAFRHIEFLRLAEKRLLLIMVTADGDVQNRVLATDKDFTQAELTNASNFLNQNYAGQTLEEIRARIRDEMRQHREDISSLMQRALEVTAQAATDSADSYVLTGERNLLASDDLASNMRRLRELFELFERKTALMQLLEQSSHAQGVHLFIGSESGIEPLDECSVVTAPYEVEGQIVGTLGVIGPTRMAYERVIPIVEVTAKILSNALSGRNT